MKFTRALVALSVVLPAVAQNNTNFTSGLISALNSAGLTTLATVLQGLGNNSTLLNALQSGNHTVFAPDNDALGSADLTSIGNITSLLAYHVAAGNVNATSLNETDTVIHTELSGAPSVLLPGNQTQVLALDKLSNGTIQIHNAGANVTVLKNATYQNLNVWVIDSVLQIPGNLSTVVQQTTELNLLSQAIQGAAPDIISLASQQKGLTLFAPNNEGFTAAAAALAGANQTTQQTVILNHVINGTAVYSPQLTNGSSWTSAAGETISVTTNSSGIFLKSANSTAKVVQANILTSNGVIHLIDGVLVNTASDPGAASSAYASATSAGANQGQQTEPVGATSTHSGALPLLDITTPLKIVAGLVFGTLIGASVL